MQHSRHVLLRVPAFLDLARLLVPPGHAVLHRGHELVLGAVGDDRHLSGDLSSLGLMGWGSIKANWCYHSDHETTGYIVNLYCSNDVGKYICTGPIYIHTNTYKHDMLCIYCYILHSIICITISHFFISSLCIYIVTIGGFLAAWRIASVFMSETWSMGLYI